MAIIDRIAEFHADMTKWRRAIHAHPETAFEEVVTGDFVAEKLAEFGIEVDRGLAGTGVVGTLKGNGEGPAIGLRADMDALHIVEKNAVDWRSRVDGKMHACGHDGHTTMLLGAARYLAETRNFSGTVYFIFQPAEEHEGGGRVMVEDGLFDKRCNTAQVALESVLSAADQEKAHTQATWHKVGGERVLDEQLLKALVEKHFRYTGSERAKELLAKTPCRGVYDDSPMRIVECTPNLMCARCTFLGEKP